MSIKQEVLSTACLYIRHETENQVTFAKQKKNVYKQRKRDNTKKGLKIGPQLQYKQVQQKQNQEQ